MGYRIRTRNLRVRRSDDGGIIIYDEVSDTGYVLNPSTAVVFDACDGFTTIEEMTKRVAKRCNLPEDVDIVLVALADLRDKGLLDNADPTTQALREIKPGLSRRQVLGRLALGAAALALFPSIVSINSASVLAEQSGLDIFAAIAVAASSSGGVVEVQLGAVGVPGPGTLEYEIVSAPTHGTALIRGNVLVYTPTPKFVGSDQITYRALFFPEGTLTTTGSPTTTLAATTTPAPTTTPVPNTTPRPTTPPPNTTAALNSVNSSTARLNSAAAESTQQVASTSAIIAISVGTDVLPSFTG
ncbi:MAG: twin-arginine translocation signal domain-containing protein [Actinobacteria bacterium]|nr:twin-arginine translocation signal domain-containing protein [Actinomycetota bacterium]